MAKAGSARVISVQDLDVMRGALAEFQEDIRAALGGVDMEIRRALQWLKVDRLNHWQNAIKQSRNDISEARTQLARKRISTAHGVPKDTLEKEMLREAQRRLHLAEDKVMRIRRCIPVLEHAVGEYNAKANMLADMVVNDVPVAMALLARMIKAVEHYAALAAPAAAADAPPGESAASYASPSAATPATATATATATKAQEQDHEPIREDAESPVTEEPR